MQLLYVIFDSRFLTFTFFIKIIDSEEFIWNTLAQRFMYDKFSIVERVCWESLYGVNEEFHPARSGYLSHVIAVFIHFA